MVHTGEYLVGLVTVEIIVEVGVVFMAQEHVHVVTAELVAPAQLLLEGVVLIVVLVAAAATIVTLTVTDHSGVVGLFGIGAQAQVTGDGEGEVFQEVEFGRSDSVHGVAHALVLVQLVLPDDVTVGVLVTGDDRLAIGVDVGTGIVLLVAVGVQDIFTGVDVVQVHRIDGGDVTAIHPRVHIGRGACGGVVEVLVGHVHIEAQLHVGGRTDVHGSAAGQTVEFGCLHVTVLIQVTYGHVVVALIGGTAGGNVVLLTEAFTDGLVEPVDIVLVAVLDVDTGNQLAILEQGVIGLVEDVHVQAFCDEVLAGIGDGVRAGIAIVILAVVLQTLPGNFHVLAGIGQLVLGNTSFINARVDAGGHGEAAFGALLGGDEDNTVGSAVTVQGGRCSILQHGHALDVGGVQVGDVATERNAIDHVQGAVATVHGTVTTDHDGRAGTGVTIGAVHLDTGYGAFQGGGNGRGGTVGNLVGANRGDGAREGGALGGTISDGHHGFFQQFVVGLQSYIHHILDGHLYGNHADAGDFQGLGAGGNAG